MKGKARLVEAGYPISRLAMGCEQLGGIDWGYVNSREVFKAVNQALECGITVFDTADVYGLGQSEEILSRALAERRHDVLIVTKFGVRWDNSQSSVGSRAKTSRDSTPAYLQKALGSLGRA